MRTLGKNKKTHTERKMFFDGDVEVARYDVVKYPQIEKITDRQLGFFWRPEEVDILRDANDFDQLTEQEQHIFTSNLKRQIVLDSVQGRAPNLAFLPLVSLPELETWIETWSFYETIHSRSYTHIIRNVYPNPDQVFDNIMNIKPIVECGKDISKFYDNLMSYPQHEGLGAGQKNFGTYEHKKALWLALNAVNALEGIRFYVSFACSWAFAELKKMEGNAKIIKFIARDENTHLAGTQTIIKRLPDDDKDFAKIKKECEEEVTQIFKDVVKQEQEWADYLFENGSMIGLNAELLKQYVEWIACKRMKAIMIPCPYDVPAANPLPWTQKWIAGGSVQVAPQETEISSYVVGGVKKDVQEDTFKGLSL
jgi:ribonucleoside-diphosphate reductase beta chain